ncbi:unnamed protein product [Linum trigynum]|uniref:Uncharacterized protein n=1 Tax=Linum trigynum TaxID=586398 RepID=A0AAV2EA00_9ROSI
MLLRSLFVSRLFILVLPVNVLLPRLRTFHFVLTRVFLPRFQSLDRVTPLDLWVMSHDVAHIPLNYAHLVFGSMMSFGDVHFPSPVPFGPLITRLFSQLEIDLSSFRTISPSQYVSIDQMLDDLEIAIGGEVFPAAAVIEVNEAEVELEEVEPEEEDDSASEDSFLADLVVKMWNQRRMCNQRKRIIRLLKIHLLQILWYLMRLMKKSLDLMRKIVFDVSCECVSDWLFSFVLFALSCLGWNLLS